MKKYLRVKLLSRALAFLPLLLASGIVHAQTWQLFGISGMQQDATQTVPGTYDHQDHTLFRINSANGALTKIVTMPWVIDSQSIGCCTANGLIYHTGGDGAYRDSPTSQVHDQDTSVVVDGGAYQDNQYMGTLNLLTLAMAGVYNANPCPNPDNPGNDIGNDGLFLPCFGLPAPVPPWVLPQYRRDSTMLDGTNRITGPNEPSGIRGIAWSTELNSWYVSDGSIYKMSADGMICTKLSSPAFLIPTDDLGGHPTGYETNSGECKAPAFIKMPSGETKLLVSYRHDHTTSGNTNGWIMIVDPVTGTNAGQIAINYPPGGGVADADNPDIVQFGGLLGLAQNPQTGVVYGLRKAGQNDTAFGRELVTIDLATGNTTLVGVLANGAFGQAITTLAFAPDILITSFTRSGNTLSFTWTGAAPATFSLQTTASLNPPVTWSTLASGLTGPSTTTPITNTVGFYRITHP